MGKRFVGECLVIDPDLIPEGVVSFVRIPHQRFAQEDQRDQPIDCQRGSCAKETNVVIAREHNPAENRSKRHADIPCHAENAVPLHAFGGAEHVRQDGIRTEAVERTKQPRSRHQDHEMPVGAGIGIAKIRHRRAKQPHRHDTFAPKPVHQ